MIEILRKPGSVTVVIVSPLPSGKPRKGLQPSNYQYWWSARSSTSTISSYGGSLTSVGEDHESRDHSSLNLKTPPRVAPKYHKRSREENDVDSSLSSITGSSSTLHDQSRLRTPSYGAAFSVTSVNPTMQEPMPISNHGSQGSSSSYENAPRPKWSGVPPVAEVERKAAPSSVGVTLKAPTSKGTLYVIASGPQSPGLSPKTPTPETPLFGSTSQRDRHRRVVVDERVVDERVVDERVVDERGQVIGGESIAIDLQLTRNGEIDLTSKQVYCYDSGGSLERDKRNGEKVPYKETTLGAVVTTTTTYTKNYPRLL
ncbi:hypothetical protein QZH41_005558 [Actinostola sp. cb2023]|nr:hypothetical protein QZH41_005558 [Actinostola sp. cb2023]